MAIDVTPPLPGFGAFITNALDRPGNVDLTDASYTGETLLRDYPKVYEAIARALFYYRLPTRTIRDLFHVNGKIVAAIRDHVTAAASTHGGAAFLVQSRAASQKDIVISRLLDTIETKIAEKADDFDITTLIGWLKEIQSSKPASNGVDHKPGRNVTYDLEDYDAVINGLMEEKKSGRQDDDGDDDSGEDLEGVDHDGNCSTGS